MPLNPHTAPQELAATAVEEPPGGLSQTPHLPFLLGRRQGAEREHPRPRKAALPVGALLVGTLAPSPHTQTSLLQALLEGLPPLRAEQLPRAGCSQQHRPGWGGWEKRRRGWGVKAG